jgi:hypothetical protein
MNKIDKITGFLYCIVMLSMTMFPPFIIGAHESVRYSFISNYRITDLYCLIDTSQLYIQYIFVSIIAAAFILASESLSNDAVRGARVKR